MELVRLVHPKHFSPERGRFIDLAFKPTSDGGGISVIDRDCALATSESLCKHITSFYPERVSGNPPIFFIFDQDDLPDSHELKHEKSIPDVGYPPDDCHCNIYGIKKEPAYNWFKRHGAEPKDMVICSAGNNYRELTVNDIIDQLNKLAANPGPP